MPLCLRADFGRGRGAEGAVVNLHFRPRPSTASPRTPSCSIRVRHDELRSGWRHGGVAGQPAGLSQVKCARASGVLDCRRFHVSNESETVRLCGMQADLETHACLGPRCTVMRHCFPSIPVNLSLIWGSDASDTPQPLLFHVLSSGVIWLFRIIDLWQGTNRWIYDLRGWLVRSIRTH